MSQVRYKFCPLCATPLEQRSVYSQARPVCPNCGFVYYHDPKVAVIAMVTHGPHLLLVQRAIAPARGLWSLPGGYMDAGELPTEAVQREVREETNLAIAVAQLLDVFPMVAPLGRPQGIVLAYHAVPADENAVALRCADDACDARWFLPDEAPAQLAFESTQTLVSRWQQGWRPA